MAERIYVLAPAKKLEPEKSSADAKTNRGRESSEHLSDADLVLRRDTDRREAWVKLPLASSSSEAARRPHPAWAVVLAVYGLAGVAPLSLRMGPRKFVWAAFSVLPLAAWVGLVWHREAATALMWSGRMPILPFLVGVGVLHCLGAAAWSRSLRLAARDERFVAEHLPAWLRYPAVLGTVSLILPGFGLLLSHRAWRAALALWNAASVSLATLVLANTDMLWTWNQKSGVEALPGRFLELLFLASAVVVAGGGLMWIGSALEGARCAHDDRPHAATRRPHLRSDLITCALVGSAVAFAFSLRPAQLAHDLDCFASSLRFTGYRVVPLVLVSTAARLDPARPEYAIRAAEVHAEMGQHGAARAIHDRLRERWEVYAKLLLRDAAASRPAPQSIRIQPGKDLVPGTATAIPSVPSGAATPQP